MMLRRRPGPQGKPSGPADSAVRLEVDRSSRQARFAVTSRLLPDVLHVYVDYSALSEIRDSVEVALDAVGGAA